jgi:hypothetical protein
MLVSAVASLVTGGLVLGFLYFVGVCLLLVGLVPLPVATYRASILPRWSAYLVAVLAVIVLGEGWVVLVGLSRIALSYVLRTQGGASPDRPSRVR